MRNKRIDKKRKDVIDSKMYEIALHFVNNKENNCFGFFFFK